MEKKIRTLGVLNGSSFSVELDEVRRGVGTTRRLAVRHPSAVVVAPLLPGDKTLLVRQFRYPLGVETLEFPAGKLNPGEDPAAAARRELEEETGYRAGGLERLLSFAPSLGYSDEIIHIFTAYDLEPGGTAPDQDEIAGSIIVEFGRLKKMILEKQIIDGSTITALAVYEWSSRGR
ncbi:MAG: NUDIX hydrolase [Pseudomonadota bacterium]